MKDAPSTRKPFDWYAAVLATGVTGPFVLWGLWVLLHPRYVLMGVIAAVFLTFVFWGFGRIRIQ